MTGTADTEAEEFAKIYKLDVIVIPPNRPLGRIENPDLVYRTEQEKWDAIVTDIVEAHKTGRPGSGRHGLDREVREAVGHARPARPEARHHHWRRFGQARGPEREVSRAGSRIRRAGRPPRLGHHRHEHGGPRHRHSARRQPGVHGAPAGARRGDCRTPAEGPGALRRRRRVRVLLAPRRLLQGGEAGVRAHLRALQGDHRRRARRGRRASAACTSSAPSATRRGASTTSCAAAPAARATRARRASTCRCRTT